MGCHIFFVRYSCSAAVPHEEDVTSHLKYKVRTAVIKQGKWPCAQMKAYTKMETTPRPLTNDDGVKHSSALPKMTSKRVAKGIFEESNGMSEWKLISNLIIGTMNYLRQYVSQKKLGRAQVFESWQSEQGVKSKWKTNKKTCPRSIGSRWSLRYVARFASCRRWNTTLVTKQLRDH